MPQTDVQRHFSLSLIEGAPVYNSTPAQAVMVFDEVCHMSPSCILRIISG